jgi:hypothetical protein
MQFVSEARFWLNSALAIATILVLLFSVKTRGRAWLIAFVALTLSGSVTFLLPPMLFRDDPSTMQTYRNFLVSANIPLALMSVAGWSCMLVFALKLRSSWRNDSAQPEQNDVLQTQIPAPDQYTKEVAASAQKIVSVCAFAGGATFVALNLTTGVVPGGFLGGAIGGGLGAIVGTIINAVRSK